MTLQSQLEKFDEKFPKMCDDTQKSWDSIEMLALCKEIRIFLTETYHLAKEEGQKDVVGMIGAKLLAKHSSQAILDAYFDAANEILEQNETNN